MTFSAQELKALYATERAFEIPSPALFADQRIDYGDDMIQFERGERASEPAIGCPAETDSRWIVTYVVTRTYSVSFDGFVPIWPAERHLSDVIFNKLMTALEKDFLARLRGD